MKSRDFDEWLGKFRTSIASYEYSFFFAVSAKYS
ncbi:hypothetical protein IMSAGC002_03937 [Lachnospiraceae bacterium]|nr:hypothetical protein IMSAGC002_03937 [Lachnospiraceae bacterium]